MNRPPIFRSTPDGYTHLIVDEKVPSDVAAKILKLLGAEMAASLVEMFDESNFGSTVRAAKRSMEN